MKNLIIRNLSKTYFDPYAGTNVTAVHDVSLDVRQGEFVSIVGPSGCGKTTILNILAGLDYASAGEVIMDGREVAGPSLDRGVVFFRGQDLTSEQMHTFVSNFGSPIHIDYFGDPAAGTQVQSAAPDEIVTGSFGVITRTLKDGMAHWADHCASCHANDGSGDTAMGRGLYPKAPDMRGPDTQSLSDGELFYLIEHGVKITGMPAWGTGTPEGEQASWHLVHFIRHLPSLTDDEVAEMEGLNPRSRAEWQALEEERRFLSGTLDAPGDAPPAHVHKP